MINLKTQSILQKINSASANSKESLADKMANALASQIRKMPNKPIHEVIGDFFQKRGTTLSDAQLSNIVSMFKIQKVSVSFKEEFAKKAANKAEFHRLLESVFGKNYDQKTAESLRQKALKGDFSWLPKVELVDDTTLQHANGAYDEKSETIFINKDKMTNPNFVMQTYIEEMGHHLDKKLNRRDTKGDEGEMFRHLFNGDKLSRQEAKRIRQENDHGTLKIHGKKVQVEFSIGGIFKSAVKGVTSVFKSAKKVVSKTVGALGDGISSIAGGAAKLFKGAGKVLKSAGKFLLNGATALARPFMDALYKGGSLVFKGIKKIVGTPLSIISKIPSTIWQGIKAAGKYIANKVVNLAKKALDNLVLWPILRGMIERRLERNPQISAEDRDRLTDQIISSMKRELSRQGKHLCDLSFSEMGRLAEQASEEVLTPYIWTRVESGIANELSGRFSADEQSEIVAEVRTRITNTIDDRNTTILQLAKNNQLESLVRETTYDVIEERVQSEIRTGIETALQGRVPTSAQTAYADEIESRVMAQISDRFTTMSENEITAVVEQTIQDVLTGWRPSLAG